MYFTKAVTAPNDAVTNHHVVITVVLEYEDTAFNVLVHSWASEAAQDAGCDPIWREQLRAPLDQIDYSKGFEQGLVDYLTSDGMLKDATKALKKIKD